MRIPTLLIAFVGVAVCVPPLPIEVDSQLNECITHGTYRDYDAVRLQQLKCTQSSYEFYIKSKQDQFWILAWMPWVSHMPTATNYYLRIGACTIHVVRDYWNMFYTADDLKRTSKSLYALFHDNRQAGIADVIVATSSKLQFQNGGQEFCKDKTMRRKKGDYYYTKIQITINVHTQDWLYIFFSTQYSAAKLSFASVDEYDDADKQRHGNPTPEDDEDEWSGDSWTDFDADYDKWADDLGPTLSAGEKHAKEFGGTIVWILVAFAVLVTFIGWSFGFYLIKRKLQQKRTSPNKTIILDD